MKERLAHLARLGIDTEFHVYPGLGHGFGLETGTAVEGIEAAEAAMGAGRSSKNTDSSVESGDCAENSAASKLAVVGAKRRFCGSLYADRAALCSCIAVLPQH